MFQLTKYKAGILTHESDLSKENGDASSLSLGSATGDKGGNSSFGDGDKDGGNNKDASSSSAAAAADQNSEGGSTKKVNGTLDPEVLELRRQIEKQVTDVGQSHRSLSEFRMKNAELEERITGKEPLFTRKL